MSSLSFFPYKLGAPNSRSSGVAPGIEGNRPLFFRSFLGAPNCELSASIADQTHSGSRRDPSTLPYGSSFPLVPSGAAKHLSEVDINLANLLFNLEGLCFARRLALHPFS